MWVGGQGSERKGLFTTRVWAVIGRKNIHKTPKSGVMDGPTDQPMDIAGYRVPCTATKKGTLAPNPDRGVRENEDN